MFHNLDGGKALRVSGLLSRYKPGLPHIRVIFIDLSPTSDKAEREAKLRPVQLVVCLLLDLLPSNILEAFRWA